MVVHAWLPPEECMSTWIELSLNKLFWGVFIFPYFFSSAIAEERFHLSQNRWRMKWASFCTPTRWSTLETNSWPNMSHSTNRNASVRSRFHEQTMWIQLIHYEHPFDSISITHIHIMITSKPWKKSTLKYIVTLRHINNWIQK